MAQFHLHSILERLVIRMGSKAVNTRLGKKWEREEKEPHEGSLWWGNYLPWWCQCQGHGCEMLLVLHWGKLHERDPWSLHFIYLHVNLYLPQNNIYFFIYWHVLNCTYIVRSFIMKFPYSPPLLLSPYCPPFLFPFHLRVPLLLSWSCFFVLISPNFYKWEKACDTCLCGTGYFS